MGQVISSPFPISKVNGIAVNTSLLSYAGNFVPYSIRRVDYIVIHYTGNRSDSAWGNANYFHNGFRDAGAHYFVDETDIYQSVKAHDAAGHCGANSYWHPNARNFNSIGIEMCCSGEYRVSEKTKNNTIKLVSEWCKILGYSAKDVDTYILRHYDVSGKMCPMQMSGKNNNEWADFKSAIRRVLSSSGDTDKDDKEACNVQLPVLHRGHDNGYVRTAQILLNKYNSAGIAEDGGFGQETERAVIDYQKDRGLAVDGWIGAETWAQLLR